MSPADAGDPGQTRIYGIRHHGPGSARSLRLALEEFRPDTVLIEGPADADPLVIHTAATSMAPPVALLGYVSEEPARAAFWPYAVFSPEWQALRYAVDNDVPVRFCDLPAAQVLAADDRSGGRDALAELAAAGGYDDAERWWDAVVESSSDTGTFEAIIEAMAALRETALIEPESDTGSESTDGPESVAVIAEPGDAPTGATPAESVGGVGDPDPAPPEPDPLVLDRHTLIREAHMRQVLRKARKDGARRIAVVCGAWHAPALQEPLGPAAADIRLLKGLPKVKATLTWVPWTHSRLAAASGYGAGITSPGWYHHLFSETERPIASWLTKVAGVLRGHDLPVSSAHIIEAVRLAETLAALRARPLAGLSEVTEATRAVLCEGDETMLRLVGSELVVGEALGAVPPEAPTVPLEADLRAEARTLRLKQEALVRTLDLDLRKERDIARSRLLHRLRLLGVHWGTPAAGTVRSTGTFRETWELRWEPEFAVRVIEASRWGTTVRVAAEAKILDTAARPGSGVTELTEALEFALLAELPGALDGLIARLGSAAAVDHDMTHLLAALPGVLRTLRYGDVRGTDTSALTHVADSMLVRICAGLPAAVTGLGDDTAAALRDQLDTATTAIHTRDHAASTEQWLTVLARLADRPDVHGLLVGRTVRLLCDADRFDTDEAARRLAAALSVGNTAAAKAAWVDGFVGGRGLVLVHDRALLELVDGWLAGLSEAQFVEVVPLLRRTFGAFESGERRAIGEAVRDGRPAAPAAPTDTDPERGLLALRTVADILGVPA
ncbi:DUF5682 family protein [Nocardia jinanensis]|uniref:Uncharacterized protein n=1 Tax=Nocardia jinanensis TaxID=382504 RepID=A0A917RHU3_9NOCA|nr:DUF5682 family protein [Nocardia jinanensis]GGL08466.1 hypothetical protein GCM10011588_23480 [Nocardia jinanensis]